MKLIAEREGVPADHIVLGVGSGEILETYGVYLGRQQGEVITVSPGYMQMTGAMARMGSQVVAVPLNEPAGARPGCDGGEGHGEHQGDLHLQPEQPVRHDRRAGAVARHFAIEVSKTVPVFIDEAYLQCSDDFAANTMAGLVRDGHNVTVARTFSKLYGLAGPADRLRHHAAGNGERDARVHARAASTCSASSAALASLEDPAYAEETRLKIKAGRDALIGVLKEFGRKYAEPQGNFVFFHTGMPIAEFRGEMRAENVIVARRLRAAAGLVPDLDRLAGGDGRVPRGAAEGAGGVTSGPIVGRESLTPPVWAEGGTRCPQRVGLKTGEEIMKRIER